MKVDMNIVLMIVLAFFVALVVWGTARTDREKNSCYDNCFPSVGKIIDDRCHCAVSHEEWHLHTVDANAM
jgi:hypothetical protein